MLGRAQSKRTSFRNRVTMSRNASLATPHSSITSATSSP
jgi:hypothetical protein